MAPSSAALAENTRGVVGRDVGGTGAAAAATKPFALLLLPLLLTAADALFARVRGTVGGG